jgi:hypothetical protein
MDEEITFHAGYCFSPPRLNKGRPVHPTTEATGPPLKRKTLGFFDSYDRKIMKIENIYGWNVMPT